MKIAYLAQLSPEIRFPPFDGPANHIRFVAQEWLTLGHQVHLITGIENQYWLSKDLNTFEALPPARKTLVERSIRKFQTIARLPYFNYFESRRYAALVQKYAAGCDVLYERSSWMSYGGLLASRRMNLPLVVEYNGDPLHDLESKGHAPHGIHRLLAMRIFANTLRSCQHIIASGQGWKDNLLQKWGISASKITVVENGSSLVAMLPRERLANFQQEPGSRPVEMVYLGGFYPWHGTQIAVEAFSTLLQQGVDARLTMIGAGAHLDETRAFAHSRGVQDRVEFTGSLAADQFAPRLANAHIALSPYCGWKEYSGLKLFDYKAAGLATIASGENGQPVTLAHNQTGLIIPPCDVSALTQAMLQLATDRTFCRRLGQNARIEAEQKHSWRSCATSILNAIAPYARN
ncbi:MAG: glycosyltransferase family 4 protein [Bellilinea sp.]|jgi:glycosyltransferase involved in cell wall biosynthesis